MENLDQRDQTIIKLLTKYLTKQFKVEEFYVKQSLLEESLIVEVVEPRIRFTILKDKIWKDIKIYIDRIFKAIKSSGPLECDICFETRPSNKFMGCPECAQRYCYKCFIAILIKGDGLVNCPFCNHLSGLRVPRGAIEMAVESIIKQNES